MFGNELVGPVDYEPYAPITEQDLIEHGVDQVSPWAPSRGSLHRSRSAIPVDGAAPALVAGH